MKFSKYLPYLILLFFVYLPSIQIQGQNCDCTKYLYVNDQDSSGVHKFSIDQSTGALTEILGVTGGLWYEGINRPHGGSFDLNGFLYIGEKFRNAEINEDPVNNQENLRMLTCDGTMLDTLFFGDFDDGEFNNFVSRGNILYVNGRDFHDVKAYDLCAGQLIGRLDYNLPGILESSDKNQNWELFEGLDGNLYTHERDYDTLIIFQIPYDISLYTDPATTIVDRYLTTELVNTGGEYYGMEQDENGNWYVLKAADVDTIFVLDPTGAVINFIADPDPTGTTGFDGGRGLEYCEESGKLYVASQNAMCVAVIDAATMTYESALSIPGGGGKDLFLSSECCPNPANLVIDTLLCDFATPSEKIFLQDLLKCDGVICGGTWTPDANNTGIDFSDCDKSIVLNSDQACGTFTLFSDGSNALSQCGQFSITLNIETIITPTVSVTGNQSFCPGDALTDLVATSNSGTATYQWQMSTDACTGPWTDIAGATADTYTPPTDLSATTYYQVIVMESGGCATGACEAVSECITVMLDQCYDVALTKSVDQSPVNLGEPVTFTVVVENLGIAVTGATVNDVLPASLTYSGTYTATTGTYDGTNWSIGNMTAGQVDSIQITALVNEEGVITNEAIVSINEIESDLENNEDEACVSVPVQYCDTDTINLLLEAEPGLSNYQWYKDGVLIDGATASSYTATETGTYTYTLTGLAPSGNCAGELCCPIVIEQISCCPPIQCIPITVIKVN